MNVTLVTVKGAGHALFSPAMDRFDQAIFDKHLNDNPAVWNCLVEKADGRNRVELEQ